MRIISPCGVVPARFRPGFPYTAKYSGTCQGKALRFPLDCYLLWCDFPFAWPDAELCNFPTRRQADQDKPYNTNVTTTAVYHTTLVWALPFARHYSGIGFLSFPQATKMFSVRPLATAQPMYSAESTRALPRVGFPIRKSRDQRLVSTSPRAYRSRPRPSSALGAKASTVCSCSLDRKNTCFHWSFQGARRPVPAKDPPGRTVSQNSTAYVVRNTEVET